jgi:hypothetical protein
MFRNPHTPQWFRSVASPQRVLVRTPAAAKTTPFFFWPFSAPADAGWTEAQVPSQQAVAGARRAVIYRRQVSPEGPDPDLDLGGFLKNPSRFLELTK